MSGKNHSKKVISFLIAGLVFLLIGYLMDYTITPIIKRIATSSFVLASGGWCFLGLALFYWWIDIKKHINGWHFITVVGMNSIFIYLFFEIVGGRWLNGYISALVGGMLTLIHLPENFILILSSLAIFFIEWYLCYFLWKKKIFFKL